MILQCSTSPKCHCAVSCQIEVHSRHVARRWKRFCQLREAAYVKRRSCRAHWTTGPKAGVVTAPEEMLRALVDLWAFVCFSADSWTTNLTNICNANCSCGEVLYEPICSYDHLQYYSPCHAGCGIQHNSASSTVSIIHTLLFCETVCWHVEKDGFISLC